MRISASRPVVRAAVAACGLAALVAILAGCSGGDGAAPQAPVASAIPAPSSTGSVTSMTSAASQSAGSSSPAPVLGSSTTGPMGYGSARPSRIDGGQDSSGIIEGVTWSSWGGPQATGTGTASYTGPNQSLAEATQEKATVVAFDLGTCGNKPAYRKLTWYFPQHGQHLNRDGALDVCGR